MKIFYFIVAHQYPDLLLRLVKSLQSPNSIICIHIDQKSDIRIFENELKQQVEACYFLNKRISVYWSGFSQVAVTLLGMQECALKKADFFVLLSGQDCLIKPLKSFETFVQQNFDTCFIESGEVEVNWHAAFQRVKIFYFEDLFRNAKNKFPALLSLINKIEGISHRLQFFVNRKVPYNYKLYGGSSWLMLSSQTINDIFEVLVIKPKLLSFFRYSQCADEHFFQTILENADLKQNIKNNNYRFIQFLEKNDNPMILQIEHYEALTLSDDFFARKIHPQKSAELLNKLENSIHA